MGPTEKYNKIVIVKKNFEKRGITLEHFGLVSQ